MSNNENKYHRKEIATQQLETAIWLFLNNKDLSSVITLAGAAGTILSQLVKNAGHEPFVDYACKIYNKVMKTTPPRKNIIILLIKN
jgi:fibrillarin-like rRNA methylase